MHPEVLILYQVGSSRVHNSFTPNDFPEMGGRNHPLQVYRFFVNTLLQYIPMVGFVQCHCVFSVTSIKIATAVAVSDFPGQLRPESAEAGLRHIPG